MILNTMSSIKMVCFNTVNGKYCYIITVVFPSLRSGTRDVRTSSSLCFSAASHPSSHTVNGRYCCNQIYWKNTIWILLCFNTASGKYCCNWQIGMGSHITNIMGFNTASGKYCCNGINGYIMAPICVFQYRKRQVLLQRQKSSWVDGSILYATFQYRKR